jgi:hypothetical protein
MTSARRISPIFALLILAPGLGACDLGLTALSELFAGPLQAISIGGDSAVAVGDTIRLEATGQVGGLVGILAYDPLRDAAWSSSDSTIAKVARPLPNPADTLAAPILVHGVRPGRVVIEASARGVTGHKLIVVTRIITQPSRRR